MPKSTTTKSLFLKDESSFGGLSKITGALHLLKSQNALDSLGRKLNAIARRARVSRQTELCSKVSSAVLSLPVSEPLRGVAEFYASLSQQVTQQEFRKRLERRIDAAEQAFVARIILELACTYDREGDLPEALRHYVEAIEAARATDCLVAVQAATSMAVIRSEDGDHLGALHDLNHLRSVIGSISHAYPHVYYEYANNLAVVLSRAGRIDESRQAIQVALASSLAPRFPEWRETAKEIEEAARIEPRRIPPALKIAAAILPARSKQTARIPAKKRQRVVFIAVLRFDLIGRTEVSLLFSTRNVVSLLDRYVKTVRIRDRP